METQIRLAVTDNDFIISNLNVKDIKLVLQIIYNNENVFYKASVMAPEEYILGVYNTKKEAIKKLKLFKKHLKLI